MIEWLVILEVLRDFTQILRIVIEGLGVHLGPAVRYTFVVISDILSLDFTPNFGLPFMSMMTVHFIIMVVCEIYIICVSIADKKGIAEVRGAGTSHEILDRSVRRVCDTIVLFLITSIFMPLLDESLQVFIKSDQTGLELLQAQIFAGVSMFTLLILNPLLLIRGIRLNRSLSTQYNYNGEIATYDIQHQPRSLKQSVDYRNFAALCNQYNYNGSYHKVIIMIYKAMLILTFQFTPHYSENIGGFVSQYLSTFVQIGICIHYIIRTQPYHDYRENRLLLLGQIALILCLLLNFGLLWIDDAKGTDSRMQIIFSVIQFFICLLLFVLYLFKIIIFKMSCLKSIAKSVLEEFEFTSINDRGIFSFAGLRNRYTNYLYFNENFYEKEREVLLNIWQPFWLKLIQQDEDFKLKKVHQMKFVTVGPQSPPYLANFQGTVQERFEENIRIMQKIGRDQYEQELACLHKKDGNYRQLIIACLNNLPGVDIYYDFTKCSQDIKNGQNNNVNFKNMKPRKSYFCRVTAIYFPLTLVLQYDDEGIIQQSSLSNPPIELKGEELLKDIWQQNQNEIIIKQRRIRRILRALSGQKINFLYCVNVKRMKFRETNGFKEDYQVDAVVTYKSGIFHYDALTSIPFKLQTGEVIDIGTGFKCSLEYTEGDGLDQEGEKFSYHRRLVLDQSFFGVLDDKGEMSAVLGDIIINNRPLWKDKIVKVENLFKQYRDHILKECEKRTQTLSYDFNISVFTAPMRCFKDRNYLQAQLKAEKNQLMHTLIEDYPEEFDKLYEKLAFFTKNNFLSYLYFFFLDIWKRNKDILIVNKNENLLNPDHKDCIIYDSTKSIYDWKDIFTKRGLRTRRGKGYFNDTLLKNFCYMVSKCQDKPENFFEKLNMIIDQSILNQSTIKHEESKFVNTKENFQFKENGDIEMQQKHTLKNNESFYPNQSTLAAYQIQNTIEKSIKQDDANSISVYNTSTYNQMFKRSGMLQFKRYISHPELLNQTIEIKSQTNLDNVMK